MSTIVLRNKSSEYTLECKCNIEEIENLSNSLLPSVETQLNTSIDMIIQNNTATFLCDGVNPMLFEFICLIFKREMTKNNILA